MTEITLRDYQVRDIERLRNAYSFGNKAVIYQLATGGGKTVVFSHVIRGATAKGRRTAVIAHRRELIGQASAKLAALGVEHGIMAADLDRDHDAPVQVCSIQSIVRRLGKLPQFSFVVADEAHHARASTWAAFLTSQPNAKLLGVTATPARTDGKGLGRHVGGLFDAIVCGPPMAQLVAEGHLAPAKCYVPGRRIDVSGMRKVGGDFAAGEELAGRASAVTGDAIVEYQAKAAGMSAIAFCVTVAHAKQVAAQFAATGLRAACVHGETPKPERDAMIAGLGDGSLDILTSCELISEGLDVPSVGAVILLRPTASLIMALQQIGRGMRPAPGKAALIVLDHAGNTLRHGQPAEDRIWTLDGVVKPEVERTTSWRCRNCGEHNPLHVVACRTCGAPRPRAPRQLAQVDGELVEAGDDPLERWRQMSYNEFRNHPRTDPQIVAFAQARGYKRGWAHHFRLEQALRFPRMAG